MTILTDSPVNYVAIAPLPVNSLTGTVATRIYVSSAYDNLSTQAVFSIVLTDESKNDLYNTQVVFQGTDYANWTGDNNTAFVYSCTNLPFTVTML